MKIYLVVFPTDYPAIDALSATHGMSHETILLSYHFLKETKDESALSKFLERWGSVLNENK